MKKINTFLMVVSLIFGCLPVACADNIDLARIKGRKTFSYDNSSNTEWTYYQYVEKTVEDSTYIEILAVDWGTNTEVSGYPEFRIFAKKNTNENIIVQRAVILIDGNMFELTFEELKLSGSHGAFVYLTSEAIPFMKSLATAQNVSVILYYAGGTVTVTYTEVEISPVGQFANDLIRIDYLNHIVSSESAYESHYQEETPITSYVFYEVTLTEESESVQNDLQISEDGWQEYQLMELGLTIFLPTSYTVYTRGMSATDPTLARLNMTPEELDQALVNGNFYLEATLDDFNSEVSVTMIGTSNNDFFTWSDSALLGMSATFSSSFADYGVEILETDIFSCNGVKYIRMHERQNTNDYTCYRIQYYTTINFQAININFVSAVDDVTETEKKFMQEVVERAVFSSDISSPGIGAFAQDTANFTYSVLNDGTASISAYNGFMSTVAIPESIEGYPVTSLTTMDGNNYVVSIYIPESVAIIESNPFSNWNSLKSITVSPDHPLFCTEDGILYSSDRSILISYPAKHDGEVFSIPEYVTRIGKNAFYGAETLTQINLPEGLMEIGDNAFFGLDSVPNITIPSTVTEIGVNPFYGMYNLEEIHVESGNKIFTVQQGALYNRKTNTLVAFPHKYVTSSFAFRGELTSIGDYAFWHNSNAINIVFPDTLTYIGDSAFCGCEKMAFSDLPVSLKTIGGAAFMFTNISTVTIPATLQSIGEACFACSNLSAVTIMPGVTEIARVMFNDCWLTKIVLPETVTVIGEMAFVNCEELVEVNIPSSVVRMGEEVFQNCPNVTVLVVKGSYGEDYCKQRGIHYQYYEPDYSSRGSFREYSLPTGPMSVTLDESKYNILVSGMSEDEDAVIRSGIPNGMFETYMRGVNKVLIMFDINEQIPTNFCISIRIKDHQYDGVDLRKCYPWEAVEVLNMIYSGFESTSSKKEIITINDVPYLKFNWMNNTETRYATIVNGDMIYIWAARKNGEVTAKDEELLLQVVQSVKYQEQTEDGSLFDRSF